MAPRSQLVVCVTVAALVVAGAVLDMFVKKERALTELRAKLDSRERYLVRLRAKMKENCCAASLVELQATYAARNSSYLAKQKYNKARKQQFDSVATSLLQLWDLEDGRQDLTTSAIFPGEAAREPIYRTPTRGWQDHQMHQLGEARLGGSGAHCLDRGT
eukprot:7385152-Prymnesium_polylepis.1